MERPMTSSGSRVATVVVAGWGVGGVLYLLVAALNRLTPLAIEPIQHGMLSGWQALLYASWVVVNAYAEAYRGFQKRFCPRVVGRAFKLARQPLGWRAVLAPAYSMSLFDAERRERITAWVLVAAIFVVVRIVRQLPQPWRGIVDGGVVVGLLWGVLVMAALFMRALRTSADEAR